jgi:two-component system, NtrC family, response regulator AtoC
VGDLSLEAQAKLLRFLEEGEFYRLGSTKKLHIKTRVVSATNKDLDRLIERNLFRSDLYYRLGVIKVNVPSLNERREDIMPLATHFLGQFGKKFGRSFKGISQEARNALLAKKWTGNIRELRNLIERAALIAASDELTVEDLGITDGRKLNSSSAPFPPIPPEGIDFPSLERSFERYYIDEAVRLSGGNETKAAKLLNINHHTLRYRKKKLGDD